MQLKFQLEFILLFVCLWCDYFSYKICKHFSFSGENLLTFHCAKHMFAVEMNLIYFDTVEFDILITSNLIKKKRERSAWYAEKGLDRHVRWIKYSFMNFDLCLVISTHSQLNLKAFNI